MKNKFIILLTLLLCSCTIRMNDEGVVVKVEKNELFSAPNHKYIITIDNVDSNIRGSIEIRTNQLYQVGDTIKFTKYDR